MNVYSIRRLRCQICKAIHHELPDCLVPYKRYEADVIETAIDHGDGLTHLPVDDSKLLRGKSWFKALSEQWMSFLLSVLRRENLELPANGLSDRSRPCLNRAWGRRKQLKKGGGALKRMACESAPCGVT